MPVYVDNCRDQVCVLNRGEGALPIRVYEQDLLLKAGQEGVFELGNDWRI
jgi:hypothetical protein